jgi:hypothetical protein
MIRAILRIEFGWWKGTTLIPRMQNAAATHRERASERLEATTGWRTKAGVCLLVTVRRCMIDDYFVSSSFRLRPSTMSSYLTTTMSYRLFYRTLITLLISGWPVFLHQSSARSISLANSYSFTSTCNLDHSQVAPRWLHFFRLFGRGRVSWNSLRGLWEDLMLDLAFRPMIFCRLSCCRGRPGKLLPFQLFHKPQTTNIWSRVYSLNTFFLTTYELKLR